MNRVKPRGEERFPVLAHNEEGNIKHFLRLGRLGKVHSGLKKITPFVACLKTGIKKTPINEGIGASITF